MLVVAVVLTVFSITRPWLSEVERIEAANTSCYDVTGETCGDQRALLFVIESDTGIVLPENAQLLYSRSGTGALDHRTSNAIISLPAGTEVVFSDQYREVEPESIELGRDQPARLRSDVAVLLDSYGLQRVVQTRDSKAPESPRKSSRISVVELESSDDQLIVVTTFE
ncbi:hypothetical protein U746_0342 [Mycolicibacterium mucogenicum 261Sha1.1M5]|nr:hypothetical protein U746_0342 [Mycolicibacterium mucogenicum 261Sha1.1M5]